MNKVKETCQMLQRLLDDAAAHGATLDSCTCADFEHITHCDHIEVLEEFAGFYSAEFMHKRYGVQQYRYRVDEDMVKQRMMIPATDAASTAKYATTAHDCTCPDFIHRGGSYIYEGKRVCKHMYAHAQNKQVHNVVPFCARPIPPLPEPIRA